jgi:Family of unknown function (DUF5662)
VMRSVFENLIYITRHKWFVMVGCWKLSRRLRLSHKMRLLYRGLKHDWSKFSLSEFVAYREHFHTAIHMKLGAGPHQPGEDSKFDDAWQHHLHRNDHHWQFWAQVVSETGSVYCLRMGTWAAYEMVADWWGAFMARKNGTPVGLWYTVNMWRIQLHPETRRLVEKLLDKVES